MRVSLILATVERTEVVRRFLESLAAEARLPVEVIVVDQNPDDRLVRILSRHGATLEIQHLRSKPGLSHARNVGVKHAHGDVIAFPDDDCWYPVGLLDKVYEALGAHPKWDGITGRSIDESGRTAPGSFDMAPGRITLESVWTRGISYTIFLRRSVVERIGDFDEALGLGAGTPFGSGEETDYLIRAIKAGYHVHYLPDLVVHHPNKIVSFDRHAARNARLYGAGMGRVLRKHAYPWRFQTKALVRPLAESILSAAHFRPRRAWYHLNAFAGRLEGLVARGSRLQSVPPAGKARPG